MYACCMCAACYIQTLYVCAGSLYGVLQIVSSTRMYVYIYIYYTDVFIYTHNACTYICIILYVLYVCTYITCVNEGVATIHRATHCQYDATV